MQVTAWLVSQGWTNIHNVSGGIDAFAQLIDPTIGIDELDLTLSQIGIGLQNLIGMNLWIFVV